MSSASGPLYNNGSDYYTKAKSLPAVPGTPSHPMSLSRSSTPQQPVDGMAASEPRLPGQRVGKRYGELTDEKGAVTWASAKARSSQVMNGYTARPKPPGGGGGGLMRRLSFSLPRWNSFGGKDSRGGKPRAGRFSGRHLPRNAAELKQAASFLLQSLWRSKLRLALLIALFTLAVLLFDATPVRRWYRRALWGGGGARFVVILAANQGGGVMEWKGPKEWAIERDSVKNKKAYARRWGYDLEIVDMATKKRYAHEWRESWEKVDTIRRCLYEYPNAEWFWWLDLNTFIMEPSYSLQKHIFDDLAKHTYRDINLYNPLGLVHPPPQPWLDPLSRSPVGDGRAESIHMVVPQDCSGFNLGSFFMRRSDWTDRLLDVWWDPVHYEQKHMQWEHKEQDVFEHLYASQPWVRPHTAFIPQRMINSFPRGACGDARNASIHYDERDRDFVVNMAGCEWGRDCWGEMFRFRELSRRLNRPWWRRAREAVFGAAAAEGKEKRIQERLANHPS